MGEEEEDGEGGGRWKEAQMEEEAPHTGSEGLSSPILLSVAVALLAPWVLSPTGRWPVCRPAESDSKASGQPSLTKGHYNLSPKAPSTEKVRQEVPLQRGSQVHMACHVSVETLFRKEGSQASPLATIDQPLASLRPRVPVPREQG
jgi:hypothetical protein